MSGHPAETKDLINKKVQNINTVDATVTNRQVSDSPPSPNVVHHLPLAPHPLTLSRVAPSAVSKGWGGLIGPPHVSKGVGVVLVSNFSCSLRSDQD